jgi:hypothetical protein
MNHKERRKLDRQKKFKGHVSEVSQQKQAEVKQAQPASQKPEQKQAPAKGE